MSLVCQETKVSTGGLLVSALIMSRAGAVAVPVVASAALLVSLADGSTVLMWLVLGLTAWAAITTVVLVAVLASPRRKVVVAASPQPAPVVRAPMRVVESRPVQALPAAVEDPVRRIVADPAGFASERTA